jgi:conserved hypothetical protein TIGR00269
MGERNSDPPTCRFCTGRPVYRDRGSGALFCLNHLEGSIRERAERIVASGLQAGDRVGIALSGGKDSTVLLYLLHSICAFRNDIELVTITVDEGICGYREHSLLAARWHAQRLGVPHQEVRFTEIAGATLDTIVRGREEQSCTLCGVLRRKALLQLAREHGITVIATGHCLNDEAQTILMNVLRGDRAGLLRNPVRDARFIPRIKPLRTVSEKEITVYAMATGIYTDLPECPYAHHALRSEVRKMVDRFEFEKPGTMARILSFPDTLRARGEPVPADSAPVPCDRCGEPSLSGLCRACRLLDSIRTPGRTPI